MTDWFRSWHGAPTDPKWLVVARRSGVSPAIVSAIAWALFDHASQCEERGSVSGFDVETYAVWSDLEESVVRAVIGAMEDKGIIIAGRLAAWERRQPKREDDSAERVRRHREHAREEGNAPQRTVTQRNAPEQNREDTETETETESTVALSDAAAPAPTRRAVKPVLQHDSDEYRLARTLAAHLQRNNPRARAPTEAGLQGWARDARLMIHADGRDPTDIRRVLDWCQHDSFWLTNILSMGKLREKFDELWLKMEREHGRSNGQAHSPTANGHTRPAAGRYADPAAEQPVAGGVRRRLGYGDAGGP